MVVVYIKLMVMSLFQEYELEEGSPSEDHRGAVEVEGGVVGQASSNSAGALGECTYSWSYTCVRGISK